MDERGLFVISMEIWYNGQKFKKMSQDNNTQQKKEELLKKLEEENERLRIEIEKRETRKKKMLKFKEYIHQVKEKKHLQEIEQEIESLFTS